MSKTVCVTGANGFVAAWIIDALLRRGYRVRGTVRNAKKSATPGVDLVEAELLTPGSFHAAVAGCQTVLHAASPYRLNVRDPQRDLVAPAVQGTLNLLDACAQSSSLKRVVLTSSMAAVTDEPDGRLLTEDDWNTKSTLTRNPYYLSKTLAERAAWKFMAERKPHFDLVVINPFIVVGPALSPELNTSNKILADLLNGTYPAIVNLQWGLVDVRDVATAHVAAAETPHARGRYLCGNEAVAMRTVAAWMRELGYGHRLPRFSLAHPPGDAVTKIASYLQPRDVGTYLRTHIGRTPRFDTSKIRRDLSLNFRPLKETIRETLADLERWQHIPPRS